MSLSRAITAVWRAIVAALKATLRLLLRVVRVALLLVLVIIPVPMTFSWMKRLVGERKNLPSETIRKD